MYLPSLPLKISSHESHFWAMQLPRYSGQDPWLGETGIYILSEVQGYGSAQLHEGGYGWVKTRLQGQYGCSFEPLNQAYLCPMEFPNLAVSPFAKEQRCWLGLPFKHYRLECTLPRSEGWLFQFPCPFSIAIRFPVIKTPKSLATLAVGSATSPKQRN